MRNVGEDLQTLYARRRQIDIAIQSLKQFQDLRRRRVRRARRDGVLPNRHRGNLARVA
jgi:hypothetical protein